MNVEKQSDTGSFGSRLRRNAVQAAYRLLPQLGQRRQHRPRPADGAGNDMLEDRDQDDKRTAEILYFARRTQFVYYFRQIEAFALAA